MQKITAHISAFETVYLQPSSYKSFVTFCCREGVGAIECNASEDEEMLDTFGSTVNSVGDSISGSSIRYASSFLSGDGVAGVVNVPYVSINLKFCVYLTNGK
ncbi:unnamed protein product [Ceratitis capitata]|uniref:(Mediterranean fruit fly) hypothetical protein n=1 Tax=Ceratitis capitata TaxID=7213 RepID=A0A811UR81_CERCA|nr:unnamed protein product [Ceratitis capitata]